MPTMMPIGRFDTCSVVRWRLFCIAIQCTCLQDLYRTMEIVRDPRFTVRWRSIRCCDCSSCAVRWKSLTTQYTCLQHAIGHLRSDAFCCQCRRCRCLCCCIRGLVRRDSKLRRCNADGDLDQMKQKISGNCSCRVCWKNKETGRLDVNYCLLAVRT